MEHPAELTREDIENVTGKSMEPGKKLWAGDEVRVVRDAQLRKALWWAAAQMNREDAMEFKQGLWAAGVKPWEN